VSTHQFAATPLLHAPAARHCCPSARCGCPPATCSQPSGSKNGPQPFAGRILGGPWPLPATPASRSRLQQGQCRPGFGQCWLGGSGSLGLAKACFHCSTAVGSMSIHNSLVKKELDWSSDDDTI